MRPLSAKTKHLHCYSAINQIVFFFFSPFHIDGLFTVSEFKSGNHIIFRSHYDASGTKDSVGQVLSISSGKEQAGEAHWNPGVR